MSYIQVLKVRVGSPDPPSRRSLVQRCGISRGGDHFGNRKYIGQGGPVPPDYSW